MFDLSGRKALVTGATGGLGGAIARTLHAQGASVAISGTRAEALDALAAELGERVVVAPCNLADKESVEALVPAAEEKLGGLDILVNNAARAIGGKVDEIDEATWNTVISTNLTSVWRGMKVCVPLMKQRGGGSIVSMSSVQSLTGFSGWAAYAAAKGGINSLTQQAALDLAPHKIRVNAVAPGLLLPSGAQTEENFRTVHGQTLLGEGARPEDVADAVAFLAQAERITGATISVDGGQRFINSPRDVMFT